MRLLHTSDWHLGHTLYGKQRGREFEAFLDWQIALLQEEKVDVLLIAGDVFDSSSPSPTAQEMYFDFLGRASNLCRRIVVVSGNHDSPPLLDAPKSLLKSLKINVVGIASREREVVEIKGDSGRTEMIVVAIPFLRDRDIRQSETGESIETREQKIVEGIRQHYKTACDDAEKIRNKIDPDIPIIASGHLFVAGGKTSEGIRETHVGTLQRLGNDIFPEMIDYLALGHLHVPQLVDSLPSRRYCGSPIPMSFGEADQDKFVILVDFEKRTPTIRPIPVPRFSSICRISGNTGEIVRKLKELSESGRETVVEVTYTALEYEPRLAEIIDDCLAKSGGGVEVLRIRNENIFIPGRIQASPVVTLEELTPTDVFQQLLDSVRDKKQIDQTAETELVAAFKEILAECESEL